MPVVVTSSHRPNNIAFRVSTNSTSWLLLGADGNTYTSVAALQAANVMPWPNLPVGSVDLLLETKGLDSTGSADGSPYHVQINPPTGTPTDATSKEMSASGQTVVFGPGVIYTVWVRKTVAGDLTEVYISY